MTEEDAPQSHQKEELIDRMRVTKEKWDAEAAASPDGPDETDALLSQAIAMAIDQGKGWSSPAEREKYLASLLDDDYIPPLFAETPEELEKSGLKDAFTTLHNEGETPGQNMLEFRTKGNTSVALGRKNVAKNIQASLSFITQCYYINMRNYPTFVLSTKITQVLSRCSQPLLSSIPLGGSYCTKR